MTAINGVLLDGAAYLFSDGASYTEDGTLSAVVGKTHVLASISTAMMSSGRAIIVPYLSHLLENNVQSFDDLRDTIESKLPAYEDSLTDLFGEDTHSPTADGKNGFRLYFAGWSERTGGTAMFSISNSLTGSDSYVAMDAKLGFSTPGLSPEENAIGHGGPVVLTPENMENVALTTLELQRQQKWKPLDDYRVGGHVELTIVRRDQIETKILKRWAEDEVGQKLQPQPVAWAQWRRDHAPAGAVMPDTTGMSKLKADILKRKAAKGKLKVVA